MWRLHRYYLKEIAVNFGITFLVMFAIVLVSGVTRGINRSEGGGLTDALLITLYFALDSLAHLLTIAFLLAVVLTYTRAAQQRELVALRAAGLGPRVAMAPAVLLGLVLTVFASLANHYIIPEVHYQKYRVVALVVRNFITNLKLDSDRIPILNTGFVMTFRDRDGDTFEDCTIYCPPNRRLEKIASPIIRVDRVAIPKPREDSETIDVYLDGIHLPILDPNVPMQAGSESLVLHVGLHDIADRGRRSDQDADVRSDQLLGEVMREVHPRPHEAMHALLRRCCFALMPALLAPIGYCVAELMRFRGRVLALVVALVPLMLFYVGEFIGARIMDRTHNPWSAWMPVVLISCVGVPLCWRQLRR
ncbi:MAG: LptF/LptG family permease [Planctomycetes bacterium]|nr:LptF/LptG family permease [Planctomycetota bacterium]